MRSSDVYVKSIWVTTVQLTGLTFPGLYLLEDAQAVMDYWRENIFGR